MGYFNTEKKKKEEENLCINEDELGFAEVASNPNIAIVCFWGVFLHEKSFLGLSFWSSGSDSVLPMQGTQIQPLRRELDPVCCKEDPGASTKT